MICKSKDLIGLTTFKPGNDFFFLKALHLILLWGFKTSIGNQ